MRNMSFAMTVDALLEGTKTVTRRLGWITLKVGEQVCAVEKAMGLGKGEKMKRLAVIEIVSVRRERLVEIETADVAREGYPHMTANEFIAKFEEATGCDENDEVTRIEFRKVRDL